MTLLGSLTQAWVSAQATLPHGWQLSGLYRFDELWIGLAEGPAFDANSPAQYAEQARRRVE